MGAVVPIFIPNQLTGPLGAPLAYLIAALVPVGWVLLDLLVITRQFNAITAVAGIIALGNGVLAFWFVDGVLFAIKDTVGLVLYIGLLAGSVVIGKPFLRPLFAQAVGAMTPEQRHQLDPVLNERSVTRALIQGTLAVAAATAVAAVINVLLNLNTVTASFGTEEFNQQVAQVNAITRIAFPFVTAGALGLALWVIYRAVFAQLPLPPGQAWHEADIWELLRKRETEA
jgi:riboflavin transporter FmnP